jgi:peptidylprolyl isomerase
MRFVYPVILFLMLLSACENKHSNPSKNKDIHKKEKDSAQSKKVLEKEEPKVIEEKPMISRALDTAKTFLLNYGKENQETKVVIETSFGNIEIQLYKDTPLHRANFIFLAKHQYFDNTLFYRVAPDFVVQGGNNDDTETSIKRNRIGEYLLYPEIKHPHSWGAVSMARYYEDNPRRLSKPYEFFIVIARKGAHHLDGEHTVFGRVTKGLDVADKISMVKADSQEWPYADIPMKVRVY